MHSQRLVIIGGGIAGLAAAWEASAHSAVQVTVVDDHLAGPGGKLRTSPVAGVATDEGADMFLTRVPEGLALADELGLGDRLRAPSAGGAAIWMDGAAHPMPTGLVLGVPVDPSSLEGSALVDPSDVEAVRAELNRTGPPVVEDCSIGALIRERFGDRIAQRLVQPLLGGINAGVIDRLSLAAVAPQLDAAARSGPSLAAALAEARPRAASVNGGAGAGAGAGTGVPVPGGSNPPFRALPGGMGELVEVLRTRLVERGVTLLDGVTARSVRRADGGLVVECEGRSLGADAVVAAVPAAAAANLLRGGPGARTVAALDELRTASVAMLRLAVRPDRVAAPPGRAGLLVPHGSGRITVAISYASTKWPHLAEDGLVRLRISVGHDGDPESPRLPEDELVGRVLAEAAELTGLDGPVEACSVVRWLDAFPQYDVGHLDRCEAIEATLAEEVPGVILTGASYRGIGIPGCIRQGRSAAKSALG